MKKLVMLIVILVFLMGTTTEAFAFGGYAHWDTAKRTANSGGLSSTNTKYYASGCILADLGYTVLDNYGYPSDGLTVTNKMRAIAFSSTGTTVDKYFASGWRAHYEQDTKGSVSNISVPSTITSYRVKCGWIDEYLRDYKGISSPIDNSALMYVDYSLIKRTYEALLGFSLGDGYINGYIADSFSNYNFQILLNTAGWTSSQRSSIETELNRCAAFCKTWYTTAATSASLIANAETYDEIAGNKIANENLVAANKVKDDIINTFKTARELGYITVVSKPTADEGVYEVNVIIKDNIAYYELLLQAKEELDLFGLDGNTLFADL